MSLRSLRFALFFLAAALSFVLCPASNAQVGNNNPTGVAGEYNGSITTAGSYDPFTGNAKRVVDDLTVVGSVGTYPLKWIRTLNSRSETGSFASGDHWKHSYAWELSLVAAGGGSQGLGGDGEDNPYEGRDGFISYPDGRKMDLYIGNSSGTLYVGPSASDPLDWVEKCVTNCVGSQHWVLMLPDGGQVHFSGPDRFSLTAFKIVGPARTRDTSHA
jgi:hypothetical protein